MTTEPNEFEAIVPAEKMPPCPLCGKPIKVPPATRADQLMVFNSPPDHIERPDGEE